MLYRMEEIMIGRDKGKFQILDIKTNEVKAWATTLQRAEDKLRLLEKVVAGTYKRKELKKRDKKTVSSCCRL